MKKNPLATNLIMLIVACLPLLYLAVIWNTIPGTIPLHYNFKMQPDRFGSKYEMWIPVLVLAGASVLVYFILRNIQRLDPKRRYAPQSSVFNKLAIGLLIFFTVLNFVIIISASRGKDLVENLIFPLLGLLLAFIGNYMNNIKPNYFAGFRLPWTLNDDD